MGAIRLQNATKQFGPQVVLADISLELYTGQIAALVGANGVGKTTLFRLIAGELTPDTGTVTRAKGVEVAYLPQANRRRRPRDRLEDPPCSARTRPCCGPAR